MLFLFASCRQNRDFVGLEFDPERVPSMITTQVETLISDSGITRYRLIADMWKVFDRAAEPHWFFPEGLYVEQFDSLFNIEGTIVADTAWNYTDKRMWRLRGNVHIQDVSGDQLWSQELFWNQNDQWISIPRDVLVRLQRADGFVLYGWGLESPHDLSDPEFWDLHDGRIPITDGMPARRRNDDEYQDFFENDEDNEIEPDEDYDTDDQVEQLYTD